MPTLHGEQGAVIADDLVRAARRAAGSAAGHVADETVTVATLDNQHLLASGVPVPRYLRTGCKTMLVARATSPPIRSSSRRSTPGNGEAT